VLILTRYLRFSLPQYNCDAAGELYDLFEKAGCNMVEFTSTDGYEHSTSKAERDGKFIGLMCDEDNQYDLSEDRAKAWVDQLKGEGVF
jgi:flavodoxin I